MSQNKERLADKNKMEKTSKEPNPGSIGFRARSDLRAGDWRCSDCTGKTMGSNLFKPDCEYCEKI